MAEVLPSPPATRARSVGWLDPRLLLGVLLVLGSVVAGSRVLASADQSQQVWAVTRDLAPGAVLTDADLQSVRVRLFDSAGRYVSAVSAKPLGYVLRRGLGAGELLPAASVGRPGADVSFRSVAVAVSRGHLPPDLAAGQQVDVYVTPDDRGRAASPSSGPAGPSGPRLVLPAVTVLERPSDSDLAGTGASEVPVLLEVRPGDVLSLMAAIAQGRIDLVRVPRLQEQAPASGSTGSP